MFEFVNGESGEHNDSLKKIKFLEEKYSIVFPQILKDYYLKFDGEKIRLKVFSVNGYDCEVAKIVPIIAEKMNFEAITDDDRIEGLIPNSFYPIARDRGGNYYYWDSETYKVYLVLIDDYENPFEVAKSVDAFLDILD